MRTAVVQALEHYLPEARVSNAELASLYPAWTAEKIFEKTGIRERSIAGEAECASDLAVIAVERLLEKVAIDRTKIDLIALCTQSPDYFLPTTACLLQDRLRLPTTTAAFDFNLGCSGYPYGLALVRGLLETGTSSNAILVMAETYSRYIHPLDRSVRTLFGDAASATLVRAVERNEPTLGPFVLGSDGSGAQNLIVLSGASRHPIDESSRIERRDESGNVRAATNLFMNGPAILEFTIRRIPEVVNELLARAEVRMEDVDHFIFHQANEYMLRYLQRKLRIPDAKFPLHFAHCGNTVSATIPIVLQHLIDSAQIKPRDLIMLVGFGVGYSWGANLMRWDPEPSA
jgi:3-oxoacyl-[acyl-carrier-protein] synthase-3